MMFEITKDKGRLLKCTEKELFCIDCGSKIKPFYYNEVTKNISCKECCAVNSYPGYDQYSAHLIDNYEIIPEVKKNV